jgi:hypothetical protein
VQWDAFLSRSLANFCAPGGRFFGGFLNNVRAQGRRTFCASREITCAIVSRFWGASLAIPCVHRRRFSVREWIFSVQRGTVLVCVLGNCV